MEGSAIDQIGTLATECFYTTVDLLSFIYQV